MRLALALFAATALCAQPESDFFERSVRPIFASKCYDCHGPKMQMAGLNLATGLGIDRLIIAGDPAQSRLAQALTYAEKVKMPPAGKLSDAEIATVKSWIQSGGHWPKSLPLAKANNIAEGRKHWSLQPVTDPRPPVVNDASWIRTPVDRFILAKLEAKALKPARPASKLALLRRATLDLTGLPPTVAEIDAFEADRSPGAFANAVDRLLASPRYGERWGRHWLDVARYADSTGMDEDNLYPHAWRYRDYVIEAFNRDLPYDRFILEQIAGDLLPQPAVAATGFLALGPRPLAQQDRMQAIYDVVDEQIDTVSKAFMGLTVACARCHDHKFDPILTTDYYSLASIFASTTQFRNHGRPGSISYMYYAPLDQTAYAKYQAHRVQTYAKQLEMEDALSEDSGRENANLRPKVGNYLVAGWKAVHEGTAAEDKQLRKWVEWLKSKSTEPYLKKWSEATAQNITEIAAGYQEAYSKSATKYDEQLAGWRSRMAREVLQDRALPDRPKIESSGNPFFTAAASNGGPMDLPDSPRVAFLRMEWKQLEKTLPEAPALASAVTDGVSVDQRVFVRGNLHSPGQPVAKQFPVAIAGDAQKPITKGSGRLELAQWLARADHPLTARVMVNRIWQWHFGDALVRTPNNWGATGETPTHPEMLDYLARQFVEQGWSIKKMHKLIMLSSTYQMNTESDREADPGNRLWSRFNRIRMSVEQIRDSFLMLDNSLDGAMGGTLMPAGKGNRPKIDVDDLKRRTIYVPVKRGSIPNLLATFDFGDATTAGDGRARTNVAPQALFMLNSRFVIDRARGFAQQLLSNSALNDSQRVERAYLMAVTRRPQPAEIDEALTYISSLSERIGGSDANLTAWQSFCHVLMSTNEFLYLP